MQQDVCIKVDLPMQTDFRKQGSFRIQRVQGISACMIAGTVNAAITAGITPIRERGDRRFETQ